MKKFAVLGSLAIIFCLFFSGCSQANCLGITYSDGSRAYNYSITLNNTDCLALGLNATEIMDLINTETLNYWQNYKNGRSLVGVDFKAQISATNPLVYNISLTYDSFEHYCNFFGTTASAVSKNNTAQIEEGVFSSKKIIADSHINTIDEFYVELNLVPSLIANINIAFANKFFAGDTTKTYQLFNKITINYMRAFDSSLKIRSNAQQTTQFVTKSGITQDTDTTYSVHLWQSTLATPTPHIKLYQITYTSLNRLVWYCTGIGLALILGLILFIIFAKKSKNNKQNLDNNLTEKLELNVQNLDNQKIDFKD